ncbi:tetratricopeptide repeat protein [Halpernia frigidisoli]|uniref:Tetratricopeptide repeat-containing protein n=1 Tax=Halpernia frigidisoli TaxID=1125876 RepID=A0A1I3IUG5_9FLAO|nr:tetratricopeptide repeat protein [Halpernia frigidisoli]SFI51598.1 Tetratricopeptide repeat-containing protein [Halpernia frigidisoli]
MRKFYYLIVLFSTLLYSQDKIEAGKKVEEGISFHDAGKFNEAIAKYDEALNLDKDNLFALTEKAMSLESSTKYDDAIEICKHIFQMYPNEDNKTVYLTYGNSLDKFGKSDLAIKIYDSGLIKFPNYYQLYYNKAIALFNLKQNDKAIKAFQKATELNPDHASSFNALAILDSSNRIASILASGRYLVLDNKTSRAKGNLDAVISLMKKGVSQKEDKSISLSIDEETLKNIDKKQKTENDFSSVDLALSMAAALDFDEKNKDQSEIQKFAEKFKTITLVMDEVKKNKKGYYWEFLAPYFIEMNKKNLIEPFANVIYLSSQNKEATEYAEKNSDKIKEFYNWSKNYNWK